MNKIPRVLGCLNGWAVAPHCWRQFLFHPVTVEQTPRWISVSIFGFVTFFDRRAPTESEHE